MSNKTQTITLPKKSFDSAKQAFITLAKNQGTSWFVVDTEEGQIKYELQK